MSYLTGVVGRKDKNVSIKIYGNYREVVGQINQALNKKLNYYLALDQSTTCTGICLADEKLNQFVVLDFRRTNTDTIFYVKELKDLISRLVFGIHVKLFITEKALHTAHRHASKVLGQLEATIRKWSKDIPELENAKYDRILPNVWKSVMIDKSKGEHRIHVKSCMARDIADQLPFLEEYYYDCPASDYDSFDAVGILLGYLKVNYDDSGMKLIYALREHRHTSSVFFKYLTNEELNGSSVEFFKGFETIKSKHKFELMLYNPKYSFYTNVGMATEHADVAIVLLEDYQIQLPLFWEFGIEIDRNKCLVMFAIRKNLLTQAEIKYAKAFNYYMELK